MTTVETPQSAERARAWLDQAEPDIRLVRHGGDWHAIALVDHPAADDIRTRVLGIGQDRTAAIAAVEAELLELAVWAFERPERARQAAQVARERHLFRHGILGTHRVACALQARDEAQPVAGEVHYAALRLGDGPHLVGDIVDQILLERRTQRHTRPLDAAQRALL